MNRASSEKYIGKFEMLYCVTLVKDLPEFDLKAGDVGTILEMYAPADFEVEFSARRGRLSALLTINAEWLRPSTEEDFKHQRNLPPNEIIASVQRHPSFPSTAGAYGNDPA